MRSRWCIRGMSGCGNSNASGANVARSVGRIWQLCVEREHAAPLVDNDGAGDLALGCRLARADVLEIKIERVDRLVVGRSHVCRHVPVVVVEDVVTGLVLEIEDL